MSLPTIRIVIPLLLVGGLLSGCSIDLGRGYHRFRGTLSGEPVDPPYEELREDPGYDLDERSGS